LLNVAANRCRTLSNVDVSMELGMRGIGRVSIETRQYIMFSRGPGYIMKNRNARKIYRPEESSTANVADNRSRNRRRLQVSRGNNRPGATAELSDAAR